MPPSIGIRILSGTSDGGATTSCAIRCRWSSSPIDNSLAHFPRPFVRAACEEPLTSYATGTMFSWRQSDASGFGVST